MRMSLEKLVQLGWYKAEGQQSDVDLMIVGGGALRGCSRPNRRCTENDQPYGLYGE
jgi:hypothetical protein